ncbi:MAG: hypothetical protein AAF763_16645, partial [Pseudomonadota bacterium]
MRSILSAAVLTLAASQAQAVNITPYYLFDGDSQLGYEIVGASVINTFDTFFRGYPPAIRDTIWLGDRDDDEAREYDLDGTPTGATSLGGDAFTQLIDGAPGRGVNYGVECCGTPNSVTVADVDWANQQELFVLPASASGILFDPTDDTLWISNLGSNAITQYDLLGSPLTSFTLDGAGQLAALAYESLTDSFWAYDKNSNSILNFDRAGDVLSDTGLDVSLDNVFGGEMPIGFSAPPGGGAEVPLPPAILPALLGVGALAAAA